MWGSHPHYVVEKEEYSKSLDNGEISFLPVLLETSVLEKYCPAIEVGAPGVGGATPDLHCGCELGFIVL